MERDSTQHMVSLLGCKLFEGRRGICRYVSYFAPYFTKVTFIVENLEKIEEPKKKKKENQKYQYLGHIFLSLLCAYNHSLVFLKKRDGII